MVTAAARRIWIDIDNPPQVQYLYPLRAAFTARGFDVLLTVRRYGNAVELLAQRTSAYRVVGRELSASKVAKAAGTIARAHALAALLRRDGRPDAVVASSRSAALTARLLGIPSFIVGDYEFASVKLYRFTRSHVLVPDVIDAGVLTARGLAPRQLHPFRGLKEDITFAGVDLDRVEPWRPPAAVDARTALVLLRPSGERTHYHDARSRSLVLAALEHLAARPDATVVFAPRYPEQVDDLERFDWVNAPVVLREGVPCVSLLQAVDLVVSAGGTMLREAAYLGIPAFSILGSSIGGVDRHLEALGRLTVIGGEDDLDRIRLVKRGPLDPLRTNPGLIDEIVTLVERRVNGHG